MTKNVGDIKAVTARIEARQAVALAEASRIAEVKALGSVPDACGSAIIQAPARGPVHTFQPIQMLPGSTERVRTGYRGRSALRIGDAFDVMHEQARRKNHDAPFTPGQISAGRDYQSLVERLICAGVRCSSMENLSRGTSGGGSYSDALLADGNRLGGLRRRIGFGVALEVRRIRPSARGPGKRRAIPDRVLVDMVCLQELALNHVLKAYGWAVAGKNRDALQQALGAALDRMRGYTWPLSHEGG